MPPRKRKAAAPKRRKEESEEEVDSLSEESAEDMSFSDEDEKKPARSGMTRSASRSQPRRATTRNIAYVDKQSDEEEEDEEDEEEEEVQKKPKIEEAGVYGLVWTTPEPTLYVLTSPEIKPSSKIVSFDMDSTLIEPKGKGKFPKNREDWKWLFPEVPEKLKALHKDGWNIVIFTNQAGIEKNKQSPADIKGKIVDLCKELGFPIQALVATATDVNRKPNTTMWDHFVKNLNGDVAPDMKVSLYVGDAAGRQAEWKAGKKKDFSCGDRAFAHNVGITFQTPEEFFLGESAVAFEWDSIDPAKVLAEIQSSDKSYTGDLPLVSDKQELIILVGQPASGKSTFAKKHIVPQGYVHVNQDTLGNKNKCLKVAAESIESGKSVVIDNTNPSVAVRAEYIALAKKKGIPYRCYNFQTNWDLSQHLNFYREKIQGVRRVPDIGYNMFKSKYEEPTTTEGFIEVKKITWIPNFENDQHKKLFLQRT